MSRHDSNFMERERVDWTLLGNLRNLGRVLLPVVAKNQQSMFRTGGLFRITDNNRDETYRSIPNAASKAANPLESVHPILPERDQVAESDQVRMRPLECCNNNWFPSSPPNDSIAIGV